jgi:predicted DNA-binding transcriptional regulator AlpA
MPKNSRKAIKAKARAPKRRDPLPTNHDSRTVIWPGELAARWGLSKPTLWRYQHAGKLPPRDFAIGDRKGWRRATIEAHEARGAL